MESVPSAAAKRRRGPSLRERLLPSLLLAAALPLTLIFFGPLDLYFGNLGEFAFGAMDFFWWCLLGTLLLFGGLAAILLPLRGRAFYVVFVLLLAVTLLLFLQGNYLNGDLSSLAGDGTDDGPDMGSMIINGILWVLLPCAAAIAAWLLAFRFHEGFRLVGIIALVTVIGMQSVNLVLTLLSGDLFAEDEASAGAITEQSYLTYRHLENVSEDGNVILFVVDRFDRKYMEQALREEPELLSELEGFTYYDDAVSIYPRTFPSLSYLATGVEADFDSPREQMLNRAYEESPFLARLAEAGYDIHLYTDSYTAYDNAASMRAYIENASVATPSVSNGLRLSLDMVRLSLYRYLPLPLKGIVGDLSTPDFHRHVTYDTGNESKYTSDMKDAYTYLSEHPLSAEVGKKNFSLIHIAGTHLPNAYDREFQAIDEEHPEYRDAMSSMAQSFAILNTYLRQLKELGLYEDATVIITGDHASIGSDSEVPLRYSHLTTLLVKERGRGEGELVRSHAPVSHEDLFATVLVSEGLSADGFGRSVFEIEETEVRERRYLFQKYQKSAGKVTYELVEFRIVGEAKDYGNWQIVSRRDLGKSIYD